MTTKATVHVFVNRRKVELEQTQLTGEQLLAAAGFQGREWDLLRLQGEGDPTGGTLIMWNDTVTVKPGDHFRVIPGNHTFGACAPTVHRELAQHVNELRAATGLEIEILEDQGRIFVLLRDAPLPAGLFRVTRSDILFITDQQYPLSAMDMFWTSPEVIRPDGSVPQGADAIETYVGRQWRRFSWHRNSIWNPAGNPLLDHFAFMESRWAAEVRK